MIIHSNCTMTMMTIMIVTHFIYMNEHLFFPAITTNDDDDDERQILFRQKQKQKHQINLIGSQKKKKSKVFIIRNI
ncbi:hypothetical protein DERP_002293 [Dermatophagoides pteronyssinus]|uniref:Secreted protein n=1 Tax=Dermatophagoides pteronyssinus TaxID=6956 RepID=A0ABQ8JHC4_DERPT|nr:hypothetical protein DERP_002293 [Dermatophagoides pteronyssinus]